MKRLLLSLAIFVLLSAFLIYGSITVKSNGKKLSDMLDSAIESAENGDTAEAQNIAKQIDDHFASVEKTLSLFIDHSTINQLGVDISQLYYLAEAEDPSEFCAHCRSAKITLTHIIASESLSFVNVM